MKSTSFSTPVLHILMTPPPHKTTNESLLKFAAYSSIATASLLIVVKLIAWFMSGALCVLASLVDSLMDAAASLINLMAVRYSLKSADEDHRFGHGKAEALAGLGQASFISGSAFFLIFQAIERLSNPQPLSSVKAGIAIMLFAIAATLVLLAIQGYVVKRTQSTAIKADALHYKTDLLTNISTVAVLMLASSNWQILDPLCALAIAGYILYSAWQIGHESMQILMDRELPSETLETIRKIALAQPDVLDVHDLRTRQSGQAVVIQFHLNINGSLTLDQAHSIAKNVEHRIQDTFPNADVTIHQDPVKHDDLPGNTPESQIVL